MKTDCSEINKLIPLYVDDMLTHIDAASVREHLSECEDCRQEYEFLKNIIATASELPKIKPSDDFNEKLHNKLIEARKNNYKTALSKFRKISAAALSAVAVIAISVVSLNVLDEKDISVSPDSSVSTVEPLEIASERMAVLPQESEAPEKTKNETEQVVKEEKNNKTSETEKSDKQDKTTQSHVAQPANILPIEEDASSGSRTVTPRVSVPPKVKVTVNVTVERSLRPLIKEILSVYPYSNGAYSLPTADYNNVMADLEAFGATTSTTREDKTSTYAQLTEKLMTSQAGEKDLIQKKLDQIDSEISNRYIILN